MPVPHTTTSLTRLATILEETLRLTRYAAVEEVADAQRQIATPTPVSPPVTAHSDDTHLVALITDILNTREESAPEVVGISRRLRALEERDSYAASAESACEEAQSAANSAEESRDGAQEANDEARRAARAAKASEDTARDLCDSAETHAESAAGSSALCQRAVDDCIILQTAAAAERARISALLGDLTETFEMCRTTRDDLVEAVDRAEDFQESDLPLARLETLVARIEKVEELMATLGMAFYRMNTRDTPVSPPVVAEDEDEDVVHEAARSIDAAYEASDSPLTLSAAERIVAVLV